MIAVQRYDSGRLAKAGTSPSGGARLSARLARTGIQVYRLADGTVRREYRPPEEVFAPSSLASFVGSVLTIGHPLQGVTPQTYAKDSAGVVIAPTRMRAEDGHDYVTALIDVARADAIQKVDAGELSELSAGYLSDFDPTPGVVPAGEPQAGEKFDGVQRNIRINHVALLGEGRARAGRGAKLLTDELQLDHAGNQTVVASVYSDDAMWENQLHSLHGKDFTKFAADYAGSNADLHFRSDAQSRSDAFHAELRAELLEGLEQQQNRAATQPAVTDQNDDLIDDQKWAKHLASFHGKDLH